MSEVTRQDIVLAFSGGLDTSFCVPWLNERDYAVHTVFCDTGGVSSDERAAIEARATELGVASHRTVDGGGALWRDFVVPFLHAGHSYQDQYPLLVSDRYLIVDAVAARAAELRTRKIAHGCTGMGNDQVRFDLTAMSLGDFEIVAPIREIQRNETDLRGYEQRYLAERGFDVPTAQRHYTINENLLGVTMSGGEIDRFEPPAPAARKLCASRDEWPTAPLERTIRFSAGEAVALDGQAITGPALLAELNHAFGAYGVGRGVYTGDTTIGLKGRIVYEAPGLVALQVARRALEEAVATRAQNRFKPSVGRRWVELVFEGLFHDPLKADLEAYLTSAARDVCGDVVIRTEGGSVEAVAIQSANLLIDPHATYAQSADWGVEEAEGFIKLFGKSTLLHARVHRDDADAG